MKAIKKLLIGFKAQRGSDFLNNTNPWRNLFFVMAAPYFPKLSYRYAKAPARITFLLPIRAA